MALHSLYCADVPLRNCSLTHFDLYLDGRLSADKYMYVNHVPNYLGELSLPSLPGR